MPQATISSASNHDVLSDKIPWKPLLPILLFRLADAANYTAVFPFLVDMVTSLHVKPSQIGLYAGLGEGVLMIVEAVAAPFWAKAADRFGRKRTVLLGFILPLLANLLVGFSTRIWQIVLWRSIVGLSPLPVVGKIIAPEISHKGNRTKVFAIFTPAFGAGSMIGTFLGGELARPYGRFPRWLGGHTGFVKRWPFALPGMATTAIGLIAVTVAIFGLEETKPKDPNSGTEDQQHPTSMRGLWIQALKVRFFVPIILLFGWLRFLDISWVGFFPNYAYTKVSQGGLGIDVPTIGIIMAASALAYLLSSPIVLPIVERRLGPTLTLKLISLAWPAIAVLIPLGALLASKNRVGMGVIVAMEQSLKTLGVLALPLSDMLTVAVFEDHPHLLATGSAISMVAGAFGRAVGPGGLSWAFSISSQYPSGSFGRQLAWIGFLVCGMLTFVLIWFMGDIEAKRPANIDEREGEAATERQPLLQGERVE